MRQKVKDRLLKYDFSSIEELPVIVNTGYGQMYFNSIQKFINDPIINEMYYVNGCVQLDLNGDDSFVLIYTTPFNMV